MTTVAIVCGYDLHSDLHDYVQSIVPVLETERCDAIILSGGRTSPVIDDSEAQAMTRALTVHLPGALVVLEERAMTTLDNILYGGEIAKQLFPATRCVVICDRAHAVKVAVLSAILLRVRFTVRSVSRKVPLRVMLFEPISIVAEAFAAVFPLFRSVLRRSAVRLKGLGAQSRRSARRATA